MIERSEVLDEIDFYDEVYAEDSGFSKKGQENRRSMPVGSQSRAKAGRRRFGKRHSYAANGSHRRFRRKSLQKPSRDVARDSP